MIFSLVGMPCVFIVVILSGLRLFCFVFPLFWPAASFVARRFADSRGGFQSEAVRVLEAPSKNPLWRAVCVFGVFVLSQLMSLFIHCATLDI
jgi:hypothetical protein